MRLMIVATLALTIGTLPGCEAAALVATPDSGLGRWQAQQHEREMAEAQQEHEREMAEARRSRAPEPKRKRSDASAKHPAKKRPAESRQSKPSALSEREREFLASEAADDSMPDLGPVNDAPAPAPPPPEQTTKPDPRGTLTAISKDGTRTPLMRMVGAHEACKLFAGYLSPGHEHHLYCTDLPLSRSSGRKSQLFMVSDDEESLMGFAVNDATCAWAAAKLHVGSAFFFCDDVTTRWKL